MTSRLFLAAVVGALAATTAGAAVLLDAAVLPAGMSQAPPAAPSTPQQAPAVPQPPAAPEVAAPDAEPGVAVVPTLDLDRLLSEVEQAVAAAVDEEAIEAQVEAALAGLDVDAIVAEALQDAESWLPDTPRLGVAVRDLTAEEASAAGLPGIAGAWVTEVRADSPAATAGLAAGDILVRVDGSDIRGVRHLTRLVAETPAGRAVQVEYVRSGQRRSATLTPERRRMTRVAPRVAPAPRAFSFRSPRPPALAPLAARGRLGITIDDLTPQLATYFGVKAGVLVTSVAEGSAAANGGLRAGDVVTRLGTTEVASSGDLLRALGGTEGGTSIELGIVRDRQASSVSVTLDAAPTRNRSGAPVRIRSAAD